MKIKFNLVIIKVIVLFLFSATILVIGIVNYDVFRKPDASGPFTEVKNFSNGKYKIRFAEQGNGPKGDGTILPIYSQESDGSNLKLEGYVSSAQWQSESSAWGISESMGNYGGDFQSPNGKRKLVVKTGIFGGWFTFFTTPKLYLEEDGQQKLILDGGFSELEWLPDSKRVVFAGTNGLGIIDIEKNQIGYLFDRPVFMIKVEER